ncbi:mRNA cap guanine-N7 methyltransferase, putative [Entamoeba histolytica HM-1:IMSS]|uniref:mRNA (guanine-N(7))-methyltransferase n=1 Tax=Entamoeba histolytica (strain ATCC 30459 / HM-1:IMSS / ABRM) TaxID=294381 RepID=B1N3H0_ENTH1|nr:mRNA cap guanine-N7 methyltransferase, putative [Entamoeba histolytica HM-1:IMSS]EDS89488.1 mRNA cap guanine-N7 methyltransferase, putative [Entamoeba histolytica HM-1:IMSS]|eukprot:XP_001913736.1 mRNA cap guanine-N7 methyltransferase, putative [Entamoeba histolytica HM-1:IMSS]
MDRRDVERGYDSKKQRNVQERKYSEIVALKRYNNWVKACLIRKYIPEHSRVLDFCGGKGGDYIKFNQNSVRSVLTCDISGESLKDAEKRYKEREPAFRFNLKTIKEDCFSSELLNKIPSNSSFEAVSCQFAIHYSFETKERAYQAIFNLTKYLRKGGLFVGTTVNAYRVVKKLRTVPGNKFGNELFTIRFDEQFDKENIPTYGAKILF